MKKTLSLILFLLLIETGYSQTTKWKVIWNPNPEKDIKEYIVSRDNVEVARVKSPDTMYVDSDITPGNLYNYRIKAVNTKNLAGPFSDPATAAIPAFKELPEILGVSSDKPTELILKNYINDPDDTNHEISRINVYPNSKINLNLQSGKLIIKANKRWQKNDIDTVEIKISDSRGFYNTAKIVIKDKAELKKIEQAIKSYKKITLFPEEFSLSQYKYLKISHIPENSNIKIYNSFGDLVYSKKDIDDTFEWDAENNRGDQVLYGLYNAILLDNSGKKIFESSFRVIP